MKIKLNVRINITSSGKEFTIWARQHRYLPGIEFYTGSGISTSEAVADLFSKLPDVFTIDDEISVRTTSSIVNTSGSFEKRSATASDVEMPDPV